MSEAEQAVAPRLADVKIDDKYTQASGRIYLSGIQALVRLGYAVDERVTQACDNLFALRQQYGGWCNSNIRDAFLAEMKNSKKVEKN